MLSNIGKRFVSKQCRTLLAFGNNQRTYTKEVVDHYDKPRNVGTFDKNDPNVGTGNVLFL